MIILPEEPGAAKCPISVLKLPCDVKIPAAILASADRSDLVQMNPALQFAIRTEEAQTRSKNAPLQKITECAIGLHLLPFDVEGFILRELRPSGCGIDSPDGGDGTAAGEGFVRRILLDQLPDAGDLEHPATLQAPHLLDEAKAHEARGTWLR